MGLAGEPVEHEGDGRLGASHDVDPFERRRGAPYATPIRPSALIRVPTGGAVAPVGNRTSTAPEPSWTTIRRPLASSRVAGAVDDGFDQRPPGL